MKHHQTMTRLELYDYVVDLKGMIKNLQGQLAKEAAKNAALSLENKSLKANSKEGKTA